ncbi:hypothetical protein F971_01960 [Acinetobacter vivianii]|uniref:Uncharacterized protein n=1 Tax=Acinetobacter vivianii TaxID=1776742 RepID=N8W5J0_9GAMM|nr:hypothetical protein [Acinetobacter vivianii]ENU92073.1 hypothetical protein F971_01960 [Acinetobacter vivianii]
MFKVGDKVTSPRNTGHPQIDSNDGIFTIVIDNPHNTMVTLVDKDGEFWNSSTQHLTHATPEEIQLGHRIEQVSTNETN